MRRSGVCALAALVALSAAAGETPLWDTLSDTWGATDALGRRVPTAPEVGPPRPDRFVGIFYFLWLGAHVAGGPHDVTRILGQDPEALGKPSSPLWGPLHAAHHWGESIFGYYLTDDPYVLRAHARMLADAGIDAVIFDVTNQFTYRRQYLALLRVFAEARRDGNRTPQVAFLCPFWDPRRVVDELFRELYEPGIHPELWFRWEGKPLILADPRLIGARAGNDKQDRAVELPAGGTLGQSFAAEAPFDAAGGCFPTWRTTEGAFTLALRRDGPRGAILAERRFENVQDNAWLSLEFDPPLPAGTYYLEMSAGRGKVGWWSHTGDVLPGGQAFAGGAAVPGDRTPALRIADERARRLREFFTFRKPQPDYFQGPTEPDMWSWLEVYPQHVFRNARGEKEQMAVGVAQNAVGGRLGSMSEPGARGRSFRGGATDPAPGAVLRGLNFAEQFERALAEDPRFIFITGWNEWVAGRHAEFSGVRLPVMFVDQFDQEHSRDIEPMRGGHGDNYYYQMVSFVRRFKGARPLPRPSAPATIRIDGGFAQWADVEPEFRDDIGDTAHRDHPGYNDCARYVNRSGRNDIVACKVARDAENLYFYARTRAPLTPAADARWMLLLIDVDCDHRTGWEGYDFLVGRTSTGATTSLERNAGGWAWEPVAAVARVSAGNEVHLAVPRAALGLGGTASFDFKWIDNMPPSGAILDFLTHGDAAPNGRFNYRWRE